MRTERSQQEHDRLVARLAERLRETEGAEVRADSPGFEPPAAISAGSEPPQVPDVTAFGRGRVLAEVETPDSLGDLQAAQQWRVFSMYAAENACRFCLVVPTGAEMVANERLQELGISAEVWPASLFEERSPGESPNPGE
jgi:hypothetical protein